MMARAGADAHPWPTPTAGSRTDPLPGGDIQPGPMARVQRERHRTTGSGESR